MIGGPLNRDRSSDQEDVNTTQSDAGASIFCSRITWEIRSISSPNVCGHAALLTSGRRRAPRSYELK